MEKIYTIPVNAAFEDGSGGCPFCKLYNQLEENELELILGASMMEPDVRIKTNEQGFCGKHFEMMLGRKNRLGLALMLESNLDKIRQDFEKQDFPAREKKLEESCYVCGRIEYSMSRMLETAALLWEVDPDFPPKLATRQYVCLPHLRMWSDVAKVKLNKKKYAAFRDALTAVTGRYFDELRGDVSWFCKKFDYRYDAEPWYNSKDAAERAVKFLSADLHQPPKDKK